MTLHGVSFLSAPPTLSGKEKVRIGGDLHSITTLLEIVFSMYFSVCYHNPAGEEEEHFSL